MDTIRRLIVLLLLLIPASLSGQDVAYGSDTFPMSEGRSSVVEGLMFENAPGVRMVRVVTITDNASGISVQGYALGAAFQMSDDTACFKVTQIAGNAPQSTIGLTYCYRYDGENDTYIMIANGSIVGPPLRRLRKSIPNNLRRA